jgi:hypothetical protein
MQQINRINRAAFAAEHAAAVQENIDRASCVQEVNAPELAASSLLAIQLGHDLGLPKAAATLLATRIVKLEFELAGLKAITQPVHIRDVERRP